MLTIAIQQDKGIEPVFGRSVMCNMSLITRYSLLTAQPSRHQHRIHVLPRLQYDRSDSSAPRYGRDYCKCFHAPTPAM
jgi:hypothetical protein